MPHLISSGIANDKDHQWIDSLLEVFRDRMHYGEEIVTLYEEFLAQEFSLTKEMKEFLAQDGVFDTLHVFRDLLENLEHFTAESIQPLIKQTGKQSGARGKMLFMPLRIATTASMHGPDLPKVLALLGKETVISRLNQVLS